MFCPVPPVRDGSLHAEGLPLLEAMLISVPTGRLPIPCAAFPQLAYTDAPPDVF
jgi:hypothetical protein